MKMKSILFEKFVMLSHVSIPPPPPPPPQLARQLFWEKEYQLAFEISRQCFTYTRALVIRVKHV